MELRHRKVGLKAILRVAGRISRGREYKRDSTATFSSKTIARSLHTNRQLTSPRPLPSESDTSGTNIVTMAEPQAGLSSTSTSQADNFPILLRSTTSPSAFDTAVWGRVFNQRHSGPARSPYAVVKARHASDVADAVRLAAREGRRVSVRSGGHSWAVWSVRDDAVLVELGDLDLDAAGELGGEDIVDGGRGGGRGAIEYDPRTRIVSCPPSMTGRVLNGFLKGKGRMFAGGHCPDVGLGGFLLQGGMGWNCKVSEDRASRNSRDVEPMLTRENHRRTGGGRASLLSASTS